MDKNLPYEIRQILNEVNGKRRYRTLEFEEIVKLTYEKVDDILKNGMMKKHLVDIELFTRYSLPNSYNYSAYYTAFVATLSKDGKIKTLEVSKEKCSTGCCWNDLKVDVRLKDFDALLDSFNRDKLKRVILNNVLSGKI